MHRRCQEIKYPANIAVGGKENKMDICINVICKRDGYKKEKIYYLLGQTCLLFNGCENMCGSKCCKDCGEENYDEAMEKFIKY